MYNAKAYSAASATSPLASRLHNDRASGTYGTRCSNRDPVLRDLPFRPAPGPQRMERRYADGLPLRATP